MAIQSYRDKDTQSLFEGQFVKQFQSFARIGLKRLTAVDAANSLSDLATIPGYRLEALSGDRKGQHSIRINDQYRICFLWTELGPTNVEIVDYH